MVPSVRQTVVPSVRHWFHQSVSFHQSDSGSIRDRLCGSISQTDSGSISQTVIPSETDSDSVRDRQWFHARDVVVTMCSAHATNICRSAYTQLKHVALATF